MYAGGLGMYPGMYGMGMGMLRGCGGLGMMGMMPGRLARQSLAFNLK